MSKSFDVCRACVIRYYNLRATTPCYLDLDLMDVVFMHAVDVIGEDPRLGCDKLLEHAVSVNIDKTKDKDAE